MASNTANAGPKFGRFNNAVAEEKPTSAAADADLVALVAHSHNTDTGYTLPVSDLATKEGTVDERYAEATRTLYAAGLAVPGGKTTVTVRAADKKTKIWFKGVSKKLPAAK